MYFFYELYNWLRKVIRVNSILSELSEIQEISYECLWKKHNFTQYVLSTNMILNTCIMNILYRCDSLKMVQTRFKNYICKSSYERRYIEAVLINMFLIKFILAIICIRAPSTASDTTT